MLGFSMVDTLARFFHRLTSSADPSETELTLRVREAAENARARLSAAGLLEVELDAQREIRERIDHDSRHAA